MRFLPLLILAALLTGCGTTKTTFDVALKNATSRPLTVGFVKDGPPSGPEWASPESYALWPPSRQPTLWGSIIEPGRTANVRVTGEFAQGEAAYLRVYAGEHTLSELLAISRGTGDRLDLALEPGRDNAFVVTTARGKLTGKLMRLEASAKNSE
jgi:hypothetical protein